MKTIASFAFAASLAAAMLLATTPSAQVQARANEVCSHSQLICTGGRKIGKDRIAISWRILGKSGNKVIVRFGGGHQMDLTRSGSRIFQWPANAKTIDYQIQACHQSSYDGRTICWGWFRYRINI
ncbi:MAG: hypothetical protein ING31_07975 [Burkholderiales bacterium]|nr:hypothetical protein [Burkholderiales bacterium]